MSKEPISLVLDALEFASLRHVDQRRKGPGAEPYVNHLIEVASLLARVAMVKDADVLRAAILHDVVEDTPTEEQEVFERFGKRVGEMVRFLTDDKSLSKKQQKAAVLARLPRGSREVKLIKLADLCSNVASVPPSWRPESIEGFLNWADQAAELCRGVSPALDEEYQTRRERQRN